MDHVLEAWQKLRLEVFTSKQDEMKRLLNNLDNSRMKVTETLLGKEDLFPDLVTAHQLEIAALTEFQKFEVIAEWEIAKGMLETKSTEVEQIRSELEEANRREIKALKQKYEKQLTSERETSTRIISEKEVQLEQITAQLNEKNMGLNEMEKQLILFLDTLPALEEHVQQWDRFKQAFQRLTTPLHQESENSILSISPMSAGPPATHHSSTLSALGQLPSVGSAYPRSATDKAQGPISLNMNRGGNSGRDGRAPSMRSGNDSPGRKVIAKKKRTFGGVSISVPTKFPTKSAPPTKLWKSAAPTPSNSNQMKNKDSKDKDCFSCLEGMPSAAFLGLDRGSDGNQNSVWACISPGCEHSFRSPELFWEHYKAEHTETVTCNLCKEVTIRRNGDSGMKHKNDCAYFGKELITINF